MNNEQQKVILEAVALATPESFEISNDSSEWATKVDEPLQSLTRHALKVFSKAEGAEIFNNLGGTVASSNYVDVESDIAETEQLAATCGCSTSSDWCWNYCSGGGCSRGGLNCGTMWQYPCDGGCQ